MRIVAEAITLGTGLFLMVASGHYLYDAYRDGLDEERRNAETHWQVKQTRDDHEKNVRLTKEPDATALLERQKMRLAYET